MYASAKYRRTKETAGCFLPVSLGAEPVRDWLKALSGADRKVLGYEPLA
jgi:hypothetical protein